MSARYGLLLALELQPKEERARLLRRNVSQGVGHAKRLVHEGSEGYHCVRSKSHVTLKHRFLQALQLKERSLQCGQVITPSVITRLFSG